MSCARLHLLGHHPSVTAVSSDDGSPVATAVETSLATSHQPVGFTGATGDAPVNVTDSLPSSSRATLGMDDRQPTSTAGQPAAFPDDAVDPPRRPPPAEEPPSLTLSIFSAASALMPRRHRIVAIVGSLAINLFLPFVNGVMLGTTNAVCLVAVLRLSNCEQALGRFLLVTTLRPPLASGRPLGIQVARAIARLV